jgi:hypothetical protein
MLEALPTNVTLTTHTADNALSAFRMLNNTSYQVANVGSVLALKNKFQPKNYGYFVDEFSRMIAVVDNSTRMFGLLMQDLFPDCSTDLLTSSKAIMDSSVLF